MSKKKSFVMYMSWGPMFETLPAEQAGALIQAIYAYQKDPDYEPEDPIIKGMFALCKATMEEDAAKYEDVCAKRAEAARAKSSKSKQMDANASNSVQADPDTESESDSESDTDNDSDSVSENESLRDNKTSCSEQAAEQTVVPDCEALILNDGSNWWPTVEKYSELQRLYPNADIQKEFAKMRAWCIGNPNKRKTKAGAMRFVTNWLNKAQDGGRSPTKPPDKFAMMEAWARGEYDKGGIFNTG